MEGRTGLREALALKTSLASLGEDRRAFCARASVAPPRGP